MSTSDSDRERSDSEFDTDDELRALLRGGDPAGSLPPADPAALASLLEDIMSADLDIRPVVDEGTRTTGTRGRNRLTWLVAAAAAAVIAGAGGFAVSALSGNDPTTPSAGESTTTTPGEGGGLAAVAAAPAAGETTELTTGDPQARCAPATPELLAQYTQAFQGEVTAIEGDTVTLATTGVFAGDVGETVEVTAPSSTFPAMVKAVDFQVGHSYYVAAWQGQLSMCGYSGPATGDVAALWQKAFLR